MQIIDRTTLLVFADRLEARAQSLPRWDLAGSETWDEFAERAYEAEMALACELEALPRCQLVMDRSRSRVRLALLGIEVRSKQGLAHACQVWVEKLRAELADPESRCCQVT